MFNNCYTFNPSDYGVYTMAKSLEQLILTKMNKIPPDVSLIYAFFQDLDDVFINTYKYNQSEDDVTLMCRNIENMCRERLKNKPDKVH